MKLKTKRVLRRGGVAVAVIVAIGLLWPSNPIIPVQGAGANDWNHETFWHNPWGKSGVHKGIDIFASEGTPVIAATPGVVVYAGDLGAGGKVAAVLGPKWRVHYYAHMARLDVGAGSAVSTGEPIGLVGSSGNAAGKPPHLHYSIVTLVPYPWRVRFQQQGWKKMFYLDPDRQLN